MSSSVFAHQGSYDEYGGHFVQKDGVAVAYHYGSQAEKGYIGWEIIFNKRIEWDDRDLLLKPLNPRSRTLGTWKWYHYFNFPCNYEVIPPTISPSEEPSEESTTSPSEEPSEESTTSPIRTPQPNSTNTLPQTGQTGHILYVIGGSILILGILLLGGRKLANKIYK
jgi:LPXTG-motif cell wall-anchored protein